ncbi:right-handed parallel beta-helix repeat-containing protein [Microbacterium sp. Se5.02b]|uniref:right-handed parallel beta-helix repeat-containing protein n=1 Tax=Microbacterium sp. Se5.02b TaxID=2864103 RepID=UPI001C6903EF|nr:right-handed parallel beta-helix repeat-containing protein [Microbacterium sp. Se5.02b]QYM64803.1 right-handed parallel beta-helix repeat-containing protein [Microbacterium sp. Se5.02b]
MDRGRRGTVGPRRARAGVHRIAPADPTAEDATLVIADAERVSIDGRGSELLFLDPHRGGFDVRRSRAVTLRGFTVDYAEPSFTQGSIRAVDYHAGSFRFMPEHGYPDFTDRVLFTGSGYGTLRDARDGALKTGVRQTFMISYETSPGADGSFLITVEPSDRAWMTDIEEGDGFVVGHRGDRHGIRIDECDGVTLREVTVHAAPCAAVLAHESSALLLERLTVARRPGSSRWISTNADAVHCQGGRRGPQIVGCRFEGMHDDGINLYVHAMRVVEPRDSRTIVVDGAAPIETGDVLQFVDADSGAVLAETKVEAVGEGAQRAVQVAEELPDAVTAGTAVYNRSNALPGFRIDSCRFHDFRGIGVRLKASAGIIADSRFEGLSGCGLWIANDPGWSEGPLGSRDVEVVGNRFVGTPATRRCRPGRTPLPPS